MRAPHVEKIALADGGYQYVMDGGRVVFEYGELPADAPLDVREQRRRWLAKLDLEGYKPPAGPGQIGAGPTAGPTYNYNYSMPVTTNMTPAAIQQSWAIMGAAMP